MPEFNASFKKKKNYKKVIYSPFVLFFLFLILLILLKAVWGVYKKEQISAQYLQKEQEQLAAVSSREKELASSIDYLKTDQGIEAEIRSKFRVVREGESVAVIVGSDATDTPNIATTTSPGLWQRFLNMLK